MSTATGAAMTAVAVLFMTSDNVIVTMISRVRTKAGDSPEDSVTIPSAISDVPPVDCSALPIGIIEPSRTITGHSIESYTSRTGTMLSAT